MAYYNNLKNDKITSLHDKIDGVKTNMIGNIDKLLDRGESLDSLLDRSDELNASAEVFKRGSTKLKVAMVKRNIVIAIVIAIVILVSESSIITIQVAIFFIIWAGCGMPKWQRCAAPAPAPVESPVVQVTPHFHIQ
jgi:vesicle-associated membrane protein 7